MALDTFDGDSNYRLDVDASLVSQSGNTSTIYWRMIVHKSNSYGHSATGNNGSSGFVDANTGRVWTDGDIQFNFQNGSTSGSFKIAEGRFNVTHKSDGTASYYVSGNLTLAMIGKAAASTGWRTLPRIQTDTVPKAPKQISVDLNEMTSLRYKYASNGDGGATILEWKVLWQEGTGTQHSVSNGKSTTFLLTGINPGATYNFWARARNAEGWGPWSTSKISGKTIAGSRVKLNGTWREAVAYVKINGAWKLAQPYSKVNGVWRKAI